MTLEQAVDCYLKIQSLKRKVTGKENASELFQVADIEPFISRLGGETTEVQQDNDEFCVYAKTRGVNLTATYKTLPRWAVLGEKYCGIKFKQKGAENE